MKLIKRYFKTKEDVHQLAVGILAALIMGAEWAGVDTSTYVSRSLAAMGAATTLYGVWVRSPKDDRVEK